MDSMDMRALLQSLIGVALIVFSQPAGAQPATNPRLVAICAPCHGFDGMGRDGTVPNLAGQNREYLARQLQAFRGGERKHPTMNFFSGEVNSKELERILDYYTSLSKS
jgi:cytochrome c553